jgi:hypothetical protein
VQQCHLLVLAPSMLVTIPFCVHACHHVVLVMA